MDQEKMIQEAKETLCQETGMTMERLEELKKIAQNAMDQIKIALKPIDGSFEMAYILNMISEKCNYASKLNLLNAMEFNADGETEESNNG